MAGTSSTSRPPATNSNLPPQSRRIARLFTKPRHHVGVFGGIEVLAVQCVKDSQVARSNVDLADAAMVDSHAQAVCLVHLLIIFLTITVQPPAHVPVELGVVAIVEHTDVTSVYAAAQLELVKEPVQF